ncbi:MAG: hypothetical protein GEEBNDBF_02201 [bacterium]|nr:hypothetical protein [bacterium]
MGTHTVWPRPLLWAAGAAVVSLLTSCAGGGGQSPASTPVLGALAPSLGHFEGRTLISSEQGAMEGIPGGWTWELQGDPLQVNVTPWRTSTGPQGNLFDLDIANFFAADTLRVTGVRLDADGNVIVDYTIKHPFPAPDFTKPISASNRADLGFTGRLLFLIDVPTAQVGSRRFFGNTVTANTDVVLNPNHFVEPGDLLATSLSGFNATAFPTRLVVDEARGGGQGNRVGVPNGGVGTGNYVAATGGWQRNNLGTNRDGWTGYDFMHQGQRATNSVVFSKEAVAAGTARFDTALLIKYTDPRGVPFFQNPQVRMPQNPADINIFAYRVPNGALDASDIAFQSLPTKTLSIGSAGGSSAPLTVRVRDWDARATETAQAVLSNDPDISKVNIGTSGAPVVTLSAPALNASDITFTAGAQSGLPGSEIQYAGTVTNTLGTAPAASRQVGLVKVVDPENSAPGRNTYTFGVDPVTLGGDPARAVKLITYQSIYFDLPSTNRAPACGSFGINGSSTIGVGGTFTVNLAGITDADADSLTIDLKYSGPTNSSTSAITLTDAQRAGEGMFNPFTDSRLTSKLQSPTIPGSYTLTATISDGTAAPVTCNVPFTVNPQSAASCGTAGINGTGPFGAPANFTLNLSTITDSDSANFAITFSYTGPQQDISDPVLFSVAGMPAETAFNPFSDPRLNFPLTRPTVAGSYNFLLQVFDGTTTTSCGPYPFTVEGVGNVPPSCGTLASQFPKTIAPGATFTLDLSGVDDPDSSPLDFSFSYIGPGGTSTSGVVSLTTAQLAGETAFNPFTDSRLAPRLVSPTVDGDYDLTVTISDRTDNTICGPYTFTVEGTPNLPPTCGATGINGSGIIPIDGTFTVDISDVDDPDTADLEFSFRYSGPGTSQSSTVTLAVASLGAEDEFDPFADSRLTTKLDPPGTAGAYQFFVTVSDGDNDVTCGPYNFTVEGVTGPPDCGAGITLSDNQFVEGEQVDFTIDMSAITDPDSLEVSITVSYTGPSSSTTSTQTVPFPLPTALNPFTNAGFTTKLTRPTLVGVYDLTVTAEDFEGNITECTTPFTIEESGGGVSPVTDIDVEVNYVDVAGTNGKRIATTNTLTVTWEETDAPQYAVYADLNPTVDRSAPTFNPVTYKANFPELSDELTLIGVTSTNSFTGFSIPEADGILIAYIVVRAREVAGSAASETADSEGAFVGILADAAARESGDPFWFIQANDPGDPVAFFLLDPDPFNLNGVAIGFDNVEPVSLGGIVSLNIPTPLEGNTDQITLTGNFFDFGWEGAEGQGEVGFTTTPTLVDLFWAPTAGGIPYSVNSTVPELLFDNVPPSTNDAHESTGAGSWIFFKYNGLPTIANGSIGTLGYSVGNVANTACGGECPAYDELAWVMD